MCSSCHPPIIELSECLLGFNFHTKLIWLHFINNVIACLIPLINIMSDWFHYMCIIHTSACTHTCLRESIRAVSRLTILSLNYFILQSLLNYFIIIVRLLWIEVKYLFALNSSTLFLQKSRTQSMIYKYKNQPKIFLLFCNLEGTFLLSYLQISPVGVTFYGYWIWI